MNNSINEKIRLFWIILLSIFFGILTDYYWQSILFFLSIYIIWLLSKLFDLEKWMSHGFSLEHLPQGGGIFDHIIYYSTKLKAQVIASKRKNQKLIVRFNDVLRSFSYPTIIINANNEMQWISKTAADILSLKRKKDIGIRINNILRNIDLNDILSSSKAGEVQIISPIDEKISLMLSISKLNKDTRIISIIDVSYNKYLNDLRQSFIANASHEMRTPLAIIHGYLEILKNSNNLNKKDKKMLDKAYEKSQNMATLITALLDFSNLENKAFDKSFFTTENANHLINEVKNDLQKTLKITQQISYKIQPNLSIMCIKNQLHRLLLNLIINAIKYSKKNGNIMVSWHINNNNKNNSLLIIEDENDVALDLDELANIINPFYRSKINANIAGAGLGLAIVSQIVKNHKGNLDIKINKNNGFLVTIDLPIKLY